MYIENSIKKKIAMDKEEIKKIFNDNSVLIRDYTGHEQMLMNQETFVSIIEQLKQNKQ